MMVMSQSQFVLKPRKPVAHYQKEDLNEDTAKMQMIMRNDCRLSLGLVVGK
mgnify:CR=1 FL=1